MSFKNRMGLAVVATAMALGCGAAQAANVNVTALDYSWQGLQGTSANLVNLPPISVTLLADYAVNDTITLTFSGGVGTFMGATPADVSCTANDEIVSFVNSPSPNVFNYRVTQKNVVSTVNDVCTFGTTVNTRFQVVASALAAVSQPVGNATGGGAVPITVNYAARATVPNLPLDQSGTNSGTVANVYDQFFADVPNAFSGQVDVNNGRTVFVAGSTNACPPSSTQCDHTTFVIYNQWHGGNPPAVTATLNGVKVKVTGNFAWTDLNANGCGDDPLGNTLTTTLGTVAVAADCQSATVTLPANTPALNATASFDLRALALGGQILPAPQSFAATSTTDWTSAFAVTGQDIVNHAAGSWTLNGFNAFVPYMPYGPTISQILYLTNKSSQTGAITVTAYDQANTPCSFTAGNAAPGVNQITTAVNAGLAACYGAALTNGDKVSMNITANIPSGLAEVYSAYNVNGNRLTVINNSNGKGTFGCPTGNCVISTNGGQL